MSTPVERPGLRAYIAPLTGLRAIAAGVVVIFHYAAAAQIYQGASLPWLTWLLGNGQNGVTIFFALSGFLITIRYREALRSRRIAFGRYWLRRFVRIYPAYFVSMVLLSALPQIIFEGSRAYSDPRVVIGLLAMGQALFLKLFALGVPIGWTLTLEEIYYVLAPTLGRLLRGGLVRVALVSGIGLAVCAALVVLIVRNPTSYAFSGFNEEFIYTVSFFARFGEFLAGALAGTLFLDHAARFSPRAQGMLRVAGLVLGLFALQTSNHFVLEKQFALSAVMRFVGAASASALMLGLSLSQQPGALSHALGSPLMDYLGKTSYSLYLVHLTWPLQKLWGGLLALPIHPLAAVPLIYFTSVLASILLYELVERPVHARLSHTSRAS
jgi:peptidoglycan/LPS O-acetylase OafA/YrhL